MQTADLTLASDLDVEAVYRLMEACKADLNEKQIYQWTADYPNRAFVEGKIEWKELYVLREGEKIVGCVVLDEREQPEWSTVRWSRAEGKYLIVHALCVDPTVQNRRYGHKIMDFCESFAVEKGYDGIRLDAFSENSIACRFYEKRGYRKMGEVQFASKPVNLQTYYCYEKLFGEAK